MKLFFYHSRVAVLSVMLSGMIGFLLFISIGTAGGSTNQDSEPLPLQIDIKTTYQHPFHTIEFVLTNVGATDMQSVTLHTHISGDITITQITPPPSFAFFTAASWSEMPLTAGDSITYTLVTEPFTAEPEKLYVSTSRGWDDGGKFYEEVIILSGNPIFLPLIGRGAD